MGLAMAVAPALVMGFVAGLFSFRIKSRWCPQCGSTLAETGPERPAGALGRRVSKQTDGEDPGKDPRRRVVQ
jgi:hypothetical protein